MCCNVPLTLIAGQISERPEVRDLVRNTAWKTGAITSSLGKETKDKQTYRDYASFQEDVNKLPPHRILALDRGEKNKALKVQVKWDYDFAEVRVAGQLELRDHPLADYLRECIAESLKRMVNPSVEREVRRELSDRAQEHAIEVFCENLRHLLLQPPLSKMRVVAIDPGYRTGCKIAAIDELGNVLAHDLIFVAKKKALDDNRDKLAEFVKTHACNVVAIGNGTASRETETLVADAIQTHNLDCQYIVVNEAGRERVFSQRSCQ